MNIAVLLTCHNRAKFTKNCLYCAEKAFANTKYNIFVHYFITDDLCTDNTIDVIQNVLPRNRFSIVYADGNAFWAGGMRKAWNAAINYGKWDFFLLLNDDTCLLEDSINDLLSVDRFSKNLYHMSGVYCGFVSDPLNLSVITYGAKYYKSSLLFRAVSLQPSGIPQVCTMPNANILLVSQNVVDSIGILDEKFIHGAADWDYGLRASSAGFPVLTSRQICGTCTYDHDNSRMEYAKVKKMRLCERYRFLTRPTSFYTDGLKFFYRYNKLKYILLRISIVLNIITPKFYYYLFRKRGH